MLALGMPFAAIAQIENVIPNSPVPPRLVNDLTGNFLTPEQSQVLENKLVAYDDSTSNQITIVIVDDLHGYSRDEYAIALGRKWGVGGKQFNNGVVILVKPKTSASNGEVFIAAGYGLEGAIPDLVADQIVQNDLLPNFKAGNNYRAFDNATDDIIAAAAGRYKAPAGYNQRGGSRGIPVFGLIIAFIVIMIIIRIISRGGGGGGGYVSRRGYRDSWGGPVIIPGGWSSGGGGGWSGGGGGFGGFGGGSFGGGGAGGSW